MLLIACALSVACVPISMLWLDHSLVSDGGGGFAATPGFQDMHARVGLPWWLLISGVGLAFLIAVGALLLAIEAIGRWLDPRDLSASSLAWSLSGVLPALIALCTYVLAGSAVGAMVAGMQLGEEDSEWAQPLLQLGALALFLFVWNPAFVAGSKPRLRSLWPRWPGVLALLLPAGVIVAGSIPGEASIQVNPGAWVWLIVALAFLADITWRWLWLNRSNSLFAAIRVASRPSVFLPGLLLDLRWLLVCASPLLVLLPLACLLILVVPQLEGDVASSTSPLAVSTVLMVQWSRFAVAYWWALVILFAALPLGAWTAWYRPVATARLLHQLGFVREEAN